MGHVSLDNDDLDGGYQPYLLFECDNVEGQDTLRKGPHRDVQSPQLVPWGVVGGSDITFAVRAECKFLTVALWDESAIHQKYNKELCSKRVPLTPIRLKDPGPEPSSAVEPTPRFGVTPQDSARQAERQRERCDSLLLAHSLRCRLLTRLWVFGCAGMCWRPGTGQRSLRSISSTIRTRAR